MDIFLGAFLRIAHWAGVEPPTATGIANEISACADYLQINQNETEARARRLAHSLSEAIPVFCAPYPYGNAIARICKIKVNENAKTPAFWGELPEFNHNEMVGLTRNSSRLTMVFLRTKQRQLTCVAE